MTYRSLLLLSSIVAACATAPSRARPLPLQKLRLYETGVGYFERAGELGGTKGAAVPVPSGHLDDALESLVVLGKDGRVESIAFDSRNSPAVARARAGLPADTSTPVRLHDVLLALRGHDVIVRGAGKRIRGRIVDVIGVPSPLAEGEAPAEGASPRTDAAEQAGMSLGRTFLLLVGRSGRFRRIDVATLAAVQPVDEALRTRFGSALDATVALRSGERRMLDIGGKGGPVRIGYLAETPVWRASYRLVVEGGGSALQGWALVHNDTEEDWHDVALELVNGRPDSFLYPMAAPRYERRELVVPDRELSSVPQLLSTTPDAMWGDFLDDGTIGLGNIGTIGHGSGSGSGSGYGYGRGGTSGTRVRTGSSDLVEVGDLAALATGAAAEARTVFAYRAAETLELAAGRSAMVPLLASRVDAAMITWMEGFGDGTARHAIRVLNSTAQTLPEGTLAVFEGGGFAGEAMLPRLKPGERRFLAIGDDPDTEATIADREQREEPKLLVFERDALTEHLVRTTSLAITLRNRSAQRRSVHVLVAAGSNTTIEGADRIDYDLDRGQPLAIFELAAASATKPRNVVVREGVTRTVSFSGITVELLEGFAAASTLPAATRKIVDDALLRRRAQAEAAERVAALEADIVIAGQDIERLRGHLQAMADGGDGEKNPLVRRLIDAEDQLAKLRTQLDSAKIELGKREAATRQALQPLVEP